MEHAMLKPQPRVNELNRPFWAGCNDQRLVVQYCSACARHIFYPRACCPFCQHGELQWQAVSGDGTVISHSTIRRTHHDGFNAEAPYVFAAVALAEGPCLYAQLQKAPIEGSLVGRAVRVTFVAHGPGQKIAAFELA